MISFIGVRKLLEQVVGFVFFSIYVMLVPVVVASATLNIEGVFYSNSSGEVGISRSDQIIYLKSKEIPEKILDEIINSHGRVVIVSVAADTVSRVVPKKNLFQKNAEVQ